MKKIEMKNSYYKTSDLYVAAFLIVSGLTFKFIKDPITKQVIFLFSDKEKAEKLVLDYMNNIPKVPVREFVETIQTLKDLIFDHI